MQSFVSTCRFLCRGSLETLVCGMQLWIDKFWLRSGSRLVCRQRLASLAAQHTTGCVTDQPCFRPRSLSAPNLSLHLTANLICTCLGWLITRGSLTISISFDQQMATFDSALAPHVNKSGVTSPRNRVASDQPVRRNRTTQLHFHAP